MVASDRILRGVAKLCSELWWQLRGVRHVQIQKNRCCMRGGKRLSYCPVYACSCPSQQKQVHIVGTHTDSCKPLLGWFGFPVHMHQYGMHVKWCCIGWGWLRKTVATHWFVLVWLIDCLNLGCPVYIGSTMLLHVAACHLNHLHWTTIQQLLSRSTANIHSSNSAISNWRSLSYYFVYFHTVLSTQYWYE